LRPEVAWCRRCCIWRPASWPGPVPTVKVLSMFSSFPIPRRSTRQYRSRRASRDWRKQTSASITSPSTTRVTQPSKALATSRRRKSKRTIQRRS